MIILIGVCFSTYYTEHTFVNYRPSLMAFSAFIAASTIAYPSKCNEVTNALAISEILSKVCCLKYLNV